MSRVYEIRRVLAALPGEASPWGPAPYLAVPQEALRTLDVTLRPFGITATEFWKRITVDWRADKNSFWAIVAWDREYPVAGHVAARRGSRHNLAMYSYAWMHARAPVLPQPLGALQVRRKAILERAATGSSLLEPVWEALKDAPEGRRWLCLPDPPPAAWVEAEAAGDTDRYRQAAAWEETPPFPDPKDFTDPEMVMAFGLGIEACEHAAWPEAVYHLNRVVHSMDKLPHAWLQLGTAYAGLGQFHAATVAFRRAVELAPYWEIAVGQLGCACLAGKRWDEAREAFETLRSRNPFSDPALRFLAEACEGSGRDAEALAALQAAARFDPDNPDVHMRLTVFLCRRGRDAEALQAAQRAVRLAPRLPMAVNNYGYSLAKVGRLEEAEACCQQALWLDPASSCAWDSLGYVYKNTGRLDAALGAFNMAIDHDPHNAEAWRHMAEAHRLLGAPEKAESALTRHRQYAVAYGAELPSAHGV